MKRDPVAFSLAARARRFFRTGPLYSWRFAGPSPDRIAFSVTDLIPGNAEKARAIYLGHFAFAGSDIDTSGGSPFAINGPNPGWTDRLHSFAWLRDLAANGEELASSNARALINDWADLCQHQIRNRPWHPVIAATRLTNLLRHSQFVLQNSNHTFYRRFCALIARHCRYLRTLARGMPANTDGMQVRIALCLAAFAIPMSPGFRKRSLERVLRMLEAQVLPDGGHISRNPEIAANMLHNLVSLTDLLEAAEEPVPDQLRRYIDRMYPALRSLMLSDGSQASLNGGGQIDSEALKALLENDTTDGGQASLTNHSGYWQAERDTTRIIADMGLPAPTGFDENAHAGLTAFELSSNGHAFIVSVGSDPTLSAETRQLVRSSHAHSMPAVDDKSIASFISRPITHQRVVTAMIDGPTELTSAEWNEPGWTGWRCEHDGFRSSKVAHERGIRISDDGRAIDGFDRFRALRDNADLDEHHIDIRFHLDPSIQVQKSPSSGTIVMWPNDNETVGWTLKLEGHDPSIENSVRFTESAGRVATRAVTVSLTATDTTVVTWRLRKSVA